MHGAHDFSLAGASHHVAGTPQGFNHSTFSFRESKASFWSNRIEDKAFE